MTDWLPTFEYEGDKVSAVFEGQVIASGDSFATVACTADEYLNSLRKEREARKREARRKNATHIHTPNGLQGEILSRVSGVFGEEITVRFANGNIRRLETAAGDNIEYSIREAAAPENPREAFEARLAAEYAPNREGLAARLAELDEVRREAGALVASETSLAEQKALHQIVMATEAEEAEIKEVLAHLDAVDAENAAPAPPVYAAAEQASFGVSAKSDWLEVTAREMIAESEAQDFDKLLAEGPAVLVADLDDAAVADAGVVREVASSFIMGKTAGFQGQEVESYREQFLAAVETARRHAAKSRTQTARKEAKQVEATLEGVSDEALFL